MTEDWNSDIIDELCNVEYGTRVVRKNDSGTIYPVYGGGGKTFSIDTFNRENRLVVSRFAMSEKCTRFINDKFFLNDSGLTISTKKPELINQKFIDYQILSLNDTIYSIGRGTAQRNLNLGSFRKLKLNFPDTIEEQKQIIEILDDTLSSIDKAQANVEKNIENAKELFQSKLNQIFSQTAEGWENRELGKISKIQYGYTAKVIPDGNVKYIRITDIQDKKVDWDSVPLVNISDEEKSKFVLEKGDIVFARTGATTGKSYLMINPINSVFASYLIRVKCDTSILSPEFLYLFFQSGIYWNHVSSGISGSAQGGFNASKLGKMKIHYPVGKEKQNEFVKSVDIVDNHIQSVLLVYKEELKNLEELKKSILQKAFTGELTNKKTHHE